ncbi:hypothetical protein CAPN006_21160 [Capnocytophaga canimorsus]|uniref:type VI secretion system protein TssR domain-containing protein n=1 Tax=Capnocytophaga canimorsus TaxID=28188 RepID=UPI001ACF8E3B|nr:type VI secretion system protein TssR domain-containing protein [Capnocytophaga canimorsus]GIM57724.1 hypothetical protein CAPN006_21160 [Capnocytophaga canimorsus]
MKKNNMKYVLYNHCVRIFFLAIIVAGCATPKAYKSPLTDLYGDIHNQSLDNGFPRQKQPWIVFSDRSKNKINPTKTDDLLLVYKEADFLEPFVVLKKKKQMLKVGQYTPEILNDGRLTKRKKKINVMGWIPQERLLLWNNSLKNTHNAFAMKATLVVNASDVMVNTNKYIENDSVIIYKSPDFNEKALKLNIGEIVYIYKESEDKEMLLIGKYPSASTDKIKENIYGWVSKNMLSLWGDRTAIRLFPNENLVSEILTTSSLNSKVAVKSTDINQRTDIENIYPTSLDKLETFPREVKYFSNPFDYHKNNIYNVLGDAVYYDTYKNILAEGKRLNIVFVVDMSQNNKSYIPIIKSLLQELRLKLASLDHFSHIKIGAVIYKSNACEVAELTLPLTGEYERITDFFEQKIQELNCNDTQVEQPTEQALLKATGLLTEAKVQGQNNLIIIMGTTASANHQAGVLVDAVTRTKARLVFFQTQAKTNDAYNNFVLMGENTVVNSAKNIAELKKQYIVDQEDVLQDNSYNLSKGDGGIYYLDFPKYSMTQGFVVFPKKGSVMPANILKSSIDSIINQIAFDNKHIANSLTKYFRSEIGVSKTTLSEVFQDSLSSIKKVPFAIASSLFNREDVAFKKGYVSSTPKNTTEIGVLLNEQEYEYLHQYYIKIYNKSGSIKNKRKAIRRYVKQLRKMSLSHKKLTRKELYTQKVSHIIGGQTGFYIEQNALMDKTLRDWKRDKHISHQQVADYFKQYKEIATKIITNKHNKKVKIKCHSQYLYWLATDYIPQIQQEEQ